MATEILRPNGAGANTGAAAQYPDSDEHWDKVDEATADEDSTYLHYNNKGGFVWDAYTLPAHSEGSGTINKVTVYGRYRCDSTPQRTNLRLGVYTHSTKEEGDEQTSTTSYANYSQEYTTNPYTDSAWTWDEIGDLQPVMELRGGDSESYKKTRCTQVWVEVDYTPVTEKTSSDAGSGAEGTPMPSAILAGSETGSGIEAFVARLLAAFDTGYGVEAVVGVGGQLKNLFATELGQGSDSLTAKIEMPTKGGGIKLWT